MRTPRNEEEHATREERCKAKDCANEFNHVCVLVFALVFAQENLFSNKINLWDRIVEHVGRVVQCVTSVTIKLTQKY